MARVKGKKKRKKSKTRLINNVDKKDEGKKEGKRRVLIVKGRRLEDKKRKRDKRMKRG